MLGEKAISAAALWTLGLNAKTGANNKVMNKREVRVQTTTTSITAKTARLQMAALRVPAKTVRHVS